MGAHSRQRTAPPAGKNLAGANRPGASARVGAFEADGDLGTAGSMVKLTWAGTPTPLETRVVRADAPKVLEFNDILWELEAFAGGTRLRLWHNTDRRFISWGAAGWHIAFDVLDHFLSGTPIGRIAGAEAMKFRGWQRLNAEYAKQFGRAAQKS